MNSADRITDLALAHLDGRLSDLEFTELSELLESDPEARAAYCELAKLDSRLHDLGALEPIIVDVPVRRTWRPVVAAAAVLAIFALALGVISRNRTEEPETTFSSTFSNGVAVITAEAQAEWENSSLGEGVSLAPGRMVLHSGLAQIDFFGGASISLSGPAEIELIDRDRAVLHRGKLRADVPPAARGFEIVTSDVILEDLGTSFGVSVGEMEEAEITVFDGEVKAIDRDGSSILLLEGDTAMVKDGTSTRRQATSEHFPGIEEVLAGSGNREDERYATWREASISRRDDPRLIAYYDFEGLTSATRRLRNRAKEGLGSELDGGIVGARVTEGRWGRKTALDFRQVGDRVRFQIPGEFDALTIYAWVRIDALDRHLNSLFLTDYFDENEFHWQLSKLGALHFACSPMGVVDIPKNNRRFYSDEFWNPEMSGQWFLLATTVDRSSGGSRVTHYIDGEPVGFSGGTNMKKHLPKLRIGGADLGNWSEPIWPDRGIRTLNGRIDEFALFDAALTPDEIQAIYEEGTP